MPHIPLNLFGASFGIAGLPGTWRPQPSAGIPAWIGDALLVVAVVSWLLTLAGYAVWAIGDRRGARTDLTDPVAAPFAALAVITPVLLAAEGIAPHAPVVGAVVTAVLCERPAATTEGTGAGVVEASRCCQLRRTTRRRERSPWRADADRGARWSVRCRG